MMHWLVGSSVRFRMLVIGIAGALMLLGATQLRNARVDILPEFSPPYVEVQTEALGLSAEEVEELITVPLEADLLNGVAFLQEIRSESITGLSSIVMTFEPGTDIFRARQVVAERLTQAHALPNVSKPPAMLQPLSSENRVMMIGLKSSELSTIEMSVLARWTMRPRLMGVPGVANVSIWGERNRQLQVLVDPEELRQAGVSLGDVIETTGNALWVSPLTFLEASTPGTGGFIDTPNQRLGIQHILPIQNAEDLSRVVVDAEDVDGSLRLGDVATVVEDHQPLIGDAVVGDGEGLLLVVEKFPDVNTLDVTRGVDSALAALAPALGGVEVDSSVFRPANFIQASIGNVSLALIIGFVLVALVLGAFLFDWRAALISLVTIPLSLAAAALVLHYSGASLNMMVLAGLIVAIGVIVDDASTSVESVLHRFRRPIHGDEDRTAASVVVDAVVEARTPGVYATLVILVALVPLFFIGGAASSFLPPMALAFGIAVLVSMLVALTVAPAMAVLLLPRDTSNRRESPVLSRVRSRYQSALGSILSRLRPSFLTGGVVVAGIAAMVALAFVPQAAGGSAIPSFHAREILIHWDGAAGTSHPEMARIVGQASRELRGIPGVQNVGAHVGRAILSDEVSNVNAGEIWLTLATSADYDSTMAAIQDAVAGYPGLGTAVVTYPQERVDSVLADSGDDVTVRVYGQDLPVLNQHAEAVRAAIAGIGGVSEATVRTSIDEPSLEVVVDLEAAARYGVKAGDVRRAAATLLSGIEVGLLFEQQKVFEVVVWGKPELRESIASVQDLGIETPTGALVRLDDVADVRVAPTPTVITREGVMRIVDVGAQVDGRDIGAVVRDVNAAVAGIGFPLEYHAEVFSPAAAQADAQLRLLLVMIGAAILVLLLLQAAFGRWRLAAFVFLTLPAAMVGGVVAGLAGGELFSLGTLGGAFTVLAISTRTGVALIDHFQKMERVQGEPFGASLVLKGAQERLGPTLMTVFGTALAVLPFVVLGDVAGLEIVRPMAIFVLGGLITSTLVTLFVLPTLYLTSGPRPVADTETLLSEPAAFEPTTA
jgi:CzcA family heavy metal efflux pump